MMDYTDVLNIIHSVINSSFLSDKKCSSLNKQFDRIKRRIGDNKIYLGIIGEFSTGKSTLINSFIGKDFFATNVLQGTTTTITKLEFGQKINLKIEFRSGNALHYHKDKAKILKLYQPDTYKQLSFLQKIRIFLGDFFHLNKADKHLLEIFDKITTTDENSTAISEVTIYYPSELLQNGIVIVDTPGTDSLNPDHEAITQRAIKDICDIALVIVPATQPLSKTLTTFLDENINDSVDKCIFFLTKIELLRRRVERLHLQNGVVQRISTYLGVDNPIVIPAPSLVSLEEKGAVEITERTSHLSREERMELCFAFNNDIKRIIEQIHNKREQTINGKIKSLILSLKKELSTDIRVKDDELKKELKNTRMMRVMPLRDFMDDFYSTHEVYHYSYIESVICNSISSNKSNFKRFVFDEIDGCSTKDATQATMERPYVISKGDSCFNDCYSSFKDILAMMHSSYTNNFNDFKELFAENFSIDAIDFNYTILNNPNWQRKYNFIYDKSDLTTFKPFRMFKSLSSVKEQMKNDVGPKIDNEFAKMEKYYIKCAQKSYVNIERQMNKVKQIFIDKYERIIAKRIKESDEKEKIITAQLNQLRDNLNLLKNLTT